MNHVHVGIRTFFLHKLAEHYGLDNALKRIEASFNLGESSKISMPKEIAAVSIDFASRGLLNMFAIQTNLDWIFPYWVTRQYDETSVSYVPGTVLSTNLTHRNWTAIGALDSKREPIVDPTGLLTPWFDSWSTDFWVGKNGYLIVPSKNSEVYQYLVKNLPIVVSQFIKKDIRMMMKAFVYKHKDVEIISHSISMENLESQPVDVSLFVNIRPYNPEGISIINDISYDREANLFLVNRKAGLYLLDQPYRVYCSNQDNEDSSNSAFTEKRREEVHCDHGLASAFAEYRYHLKAGEVKETEVRLTTFPLEKSVIEGAPVRELSYQTMKRQVIVEWDERLKDSMSVRLPYQKLQNSFNANKAFLYLFIDDNVITPGPFTYHGQWFRDTAYMATALEKMGFQAETERILLDFPRRQKNDGYFLSQEGEWDSNGQAIWSYHEHYLYTRSKEFLEKIYDSACQGFLWIKNNRDEKTGLLPPGYSAEHFGPNDSFYWDDFWSLAGVRSFASIAKILGKEKAVGETAAFYKEYTKSVFDSIESVQHRFGFPIIPSSPHRGIDSSIVGAISALYPLRLVPPGDEKISGTLQVLRARYQQNIGFFHRVIHSGYNVYLTLQIAQCYLFQKSSRVLPILQWVIDHISGTGSFPEAIHPVTKGGCMGDGHHGWACAELLNLIRNLLFFEESSFAGGDAFAGSDFSDVIGGIVITPVVYHRWMEAGEIIEVKKAASYYGKISFTIDSRSDRTILTLNNEYTVLPKFIEFSIPFFIKKVIIDHKELTMCDENTIRFPPSTKEVVVYR